MLGKFVQTEIHSAKGRADVIVETEDFVYIFEFKRDKSAREALSQIEEKGYKSVINYFRSKDNTLCQDGDCPHLDTRRFGKSFLYKSA